MEVNMSDDVTTAHLGLPPSLAAAWGVRDRPSKGPKPALTVERIVEAAVKIAQSEGLEAVSMSRVAAAVGAATMSLYRHVAAKDELFALMLDAGTGEPPADLPDPSVGWRTGLHAWAEAMRRSLLQSPWITHLPLAGPPITPHQIQWLERGLRYLADTALAPQEKLSTIMLVSGYVWRDSMLMSDMITAHQRDEKWRTVLLNYGATLTRLVDRERFPAVTAVIESGIFDAVGEVDIETDFRFGLDMVLDGVEQLALRRAAE
jgi:AcrR family transcriptional regulator